MAKNGEGPVLPQVGDHLPHTLEQDGFLGGVKIFFLTFHTFIQGVNTLLKDIFVYSMVLLGFGLREPITSKMALSLKVDAMPHATLHVTL